jgi:hypothetical protein
MWIQLGAGAVTQVTPRPAHAQVKMPGGGERPDDLKHAGEHDARPDKDRVGALGLDVIASKERQECNTGPDDGEVEDQRTCRGRTETIVRLKDRTEHRDDADQRHVGQHGHQQLKPQPCHVTGASGVVVHDEEDDFGHDDHRVEHEAEEEQRERCEPAGLYGITCIEAGVDREERSAQGPFTEETAKEVRHHEAERERVHDRTDAEGPAECGIAGQTGETREKRQQREGPGVSLEPVAGAVSATAVAIGRPAGITRRWGGAGGHPWPRVKRRTGFVNSRTRQPALETTITALDISGSTRRRAISTVAVRVPFSNTSFASAGSMRCSRRVQPLDA